MRALITGGGGQLASDLATLLGPDARVLDRKALDITDPDRLDRVFADVDPDVVFNCAAFHNVDVCETEPERSWHVNVEAVRRLALAVRCWSTFRPTTCSMASERSHTRSTTFRRLGRSTRLRNSPANTPRWVIANEPWSSEPRVSTGCTGVSARAETSSSG